jgi:uncharacterized protein (TIGR03067 family)
MDPIVKRFQGAWRAVRLETVAGRVPDEVARELRYVFDGERVTLYEGDRPTGAGVVTVHPETVPAGIDVAMVDGPGRGQVAQGMFEFAGGRLRLCIGPDRPARFAPAGAASLVELEPIPIR